ncbi:tail fiber protein [Pseudomonas sp. PB106]|uniref:tail fiber protein n=1 Tax=Pseudomonas sp. PB106 TaxID=2494699 RepID=UPI002113EC01|nr:tail fiber protein [Pseudomonas sp. PB106]
MADYYTLLTNAGIAYETACKAAGTPIKLTQISVGDGGGTVYNPAATATALKREVWRGPLNALFQDEKNPSWLLAEVTIPPDVGGWYVREAGLWTDTGILYAIVKYPESFKPVLATSGSGKEFYIRSIFETSNASLVTLQIDDTVVKATRAWVMSYLAEELGKLDGKQSVRVAATGNVVLNGAQQIDGVAVVAGDRVLLPSQTLAKDNGLWVVANGDWVRATDANSNAKVTPGLTVMVEEGTANGDSLWHLTTNAPITLGTTALTFKMLAGRTGIAAGTYKSLTVDEYGRATAGANPETLAGFGIKDSYTKAEVEALIAKASALPVGSIVAFPVDAPPPGFLELDNSVKSSETYPDLSAYLGGKFDKGDEGVGNFRLPEARGEFLRGWDHGRGVDAGRVVGSPQKGTVTTFDSNPNPNLTVEVVQASVAAAQADVFISADYPGVARTYTTSGVVTSSILADGGVVRPRNIAVMWCIKAWNAPVNQGNIDVAALVKEVSRLGSAVPVGAVMAFPTGIVPPGFLELDGSVQSIATYPDLAAYLGATYNKGDEGAGSFRLPDSRGEFLRGWDHGRGVDADRTVGSWQKGTLVSYDTSAGGAGIQAPRTTAASADTIASFGADTVAAGLYPGVAESGVPSTAAPLGSASVYGSARPRNLAVMWCIKAWNAPINQGNIDIAALAKDVEQVKSTVPVGAVLAFPTGTVPAGFLELNGSVQSIATYPDLASYLGTTYNKGDEGAGNFRLPESRGEFLRGWDHGRGVDAGRLIGSLQADALQEHWHTVLTPGSGSVMPTDGNITTFDFPTVPYYKGGLVNGRILATGAAGARLASETRSRNIAVMWCIKAWSAPVNQGNIDIAELAARTGRYLGTQVITSTAQYIPTPGMKKVRIRAIGGGGGSGGTAATGAAASSASGGGAGGSWAEGWFAASEIGAGLFVSVGEGGAGGSAGAAGQPGGSTTVGTLMACPGGGGSSPSTSVSTSISGLWGAGIPGLPAQGGTVFNGAGMSGGYGISTNGSTLAGTGGSSPFGGGGYVAASAKPGSGYGSGASGSPVGPSSVARPGAAGANGVAIFEEYA